MPRTKKTDAAPAQKPAAKKSPALIAYHVPDRENPFWTKIGAAFAHEDGKGLTLDLELWPVAGGRIVLREPKADAFRLAQPAQRAADSPAAKGAHVTPDRSDGPAQPIASVRAAAARPRRGHLRLCSPPQNGHVPPA